MNELLSDAAVAERVFEHIDNGTTDLGDHGWREPVKHYVDPERFAAELELMKRLPVPFCPSAALPKVGSYVAREAAGTPLVVVRGEDDQVRAFRNACRHRGMALAEGTGCANAFVCGYHGWTYRLDGRLQHVPHAHGFPDLDKAAHSLVPVTAVERAGLVWVTQEEPLLEDDGLDDLPEIIAPSQKIFSSTDKVAGLNWKLNMEGNLEGYHIKPVHRETFYPYGYDNLNVVETFGNHSRVTFPFRRIEKLRDVPPAERKVGGLVTYFYNLFPTVGVAALSSHTALLISEPLSPSETRFITYQLAAAAGHESEEDVERARRDADFVTNSGVTEDQAVVGGIQRSLASGANEHFTYGRFEKAIVHFHETLTGMLDAARRA